MKMKCMQWLAVVALFWPAVWAQAAITCNVSSPGFTTSYDPADAAQTIVQTQLTVTCQRSDAGDPTSQLFSIRANNGLYPLAGNNRVKRTTANNYIRYELYSDSACASLWSNNSTRIAGSVSMSGLVPSSVTISYWGCIPAGQNRPAGIYNDTVTMTLFDGMSATVLNTGAISVALHSQATCSISSAPGLMTFNYASFGPAANASTTFGATCTDLLPYTLSLDATGGTLLGMNYSLTLSASSAIGNGVQQTHTISGTMAAGQAGTCATGSCSATQTHTLVITY